jgi:hypothetical protein
MSIHISLSAAMRGIALSSLLAPMAMAASTSTWFYGATDNSSTTFGVTADNSQAITWMDSWAGGTNKDGTKFNDTGLAVNRPSRFGAGQSIMTFGFDGTGLSAGDVTDATLYLRQDFSSPNNVTNTWNIVGIAAGNNNWDTANMTWNDLDTSSASIDWTGGTLLDSLTGSYGSFDITGSSTDLNVPINITTAFQDYLSGAISGIAFVNSTLGTTPSAIDNLFVVYSDQNVTASNRPGLLVTTIPEPTSALFLPLCALLVLRRRR